MGGKEERQGVRSHADTVCEGGGSGEEKVGGIGGIGLRGALRSPRQAMILNPNQQAMTLNPNQQAMILNRETPGKTLQRESGSSS